MTSNGSSLLPLRALRRGLERVFTLDLRSLALFRIGLGLCALLDTCFRLRDVEVFLSDDGIAPRPRDLGAAMWARPSLHWLSGEVEVQTALLVVAALASVGLMLGWRTRVMNATAWVLVVSVQNRNLTTDTGADALLAGLLLLGLLLPLGHRLSFDARRAPERTRKSNALLSPVTAALVLHVVVIYFFNVLNKRGHTWWNGNAVLQALHIDHNTTALGLVIREDLPWLSAPLTYGTLVVEAAAVLLLLPFFVARVRVVLIGLFWGLHIGLAACLDLALFSPLCMVAWLAFLPAEVWRKEAAAAEGGAAEGASGFAFFFSCAFFVCFVGSEVAINVQRAWSLPALPVAVTTPARWLSVNEAWRMFSPNPGRNDGWWVLEGKLAPASSSIRCAAARRRRSPSRRAWARSIRRASGARC